MHLVVDGRNDSDIMECDIWNKKTTEKKRMKKVLSYGYLFSGLLPFIILSFFFHPAWTAEEYSQHVSTVYWFAAGWELIYFVFAIWKKWDYLALSVCLMYHYSDFFRPLNRDWEPIFWAVSAFVIVLKVSAYLVLRKAGPTADEKKHSRGVRASLWTDCTCIVCLLIDLLIGQ